uniref:Uncharacterized protein n=1 Tax=Megaselia scalaris TaxID=36166 RepID=T1GKE6_MEGSC
MLAIRIDENHNALGPNVNLASHNIEVVLYNELFVFFHRDPSTSSRAGKALSENDIVTSLPEESEERTGRLIDMAMQSAVDFFSTHNLNVKVPAETTQEIARSIEEGRGKLKKVAGPLVMAIGAKLITIIPLILGIGGYNANQWSGSNGWSSGSGSYPYARSLSDAQDLAYGKQVQAQ